MKPIQEHSATKGRRLETYKIQLGLSAMPLVNDHSVVYLTCKNPGNIVCPQTPL